MTGIEKTLESLARRAELLTSVSGLIDSQLKLAVKKMASADLVLRKAILLRVTSKHGSFRYWQRRKFLISSGLFDASYYLNACPELAESRQHPVDHYLINGARSGISPHPLFDGRWYLEHNPDVQAKGHNPLEHFLNFGGVERRSPHPLFDTDFYLRSYPDIAGSGMNPLVHYIRHGGAEGRQPHPLFDAAGYLDIFPELSSSEISPLEHYCRYGVFLPFRPCRYFDPNFYLERNPEVLASGMNPLIHFVAHGAAQGCDPGADFSIAAYWQKNPEARDCTENPLSHFLKHNELHGEDRAQVCEELTASSLQAVDVPAWQAEVLTSPEDAEPPTQCLQDFLYDEFGLDTRTRIVSAMQRFRLPLSPTSSIPADDDLEALAAIVSNLAKAHPEAGEPDVSIIIPAYNQVRFTLACLYSVLSSSTKYTYELIVADDCSGDATPSFFAHGLPNIRHVRSTTNLGFLRNCNAAAKCAAGRIIVFLNNDTYVLPGWLDNLVETLDASPDIGLVGSKLIFADGRLQESGGLIFADGSGWNFGRFDNPRKPEYCYLRDTDYVSGASIAISAALWNSLGGFDERYEMAYYEDTDLAFQVRDAGKRVVVQPLSQLIHFEGISSGTDITTGVKRYQVVNAETFRRRWANTLTDHGLADPDRLPTHRRSKGTILVVDARTPMPDRDSGSMDTYQYLRILKKIGFHVIFVPENLAHSGNYSADLQRLGIQVLYAPYWMSFDQILAAKGATLDYVLLYRAPVAGPIFDLMRRYAPQAKIIFDTVDLHFLRMEREAELAGDEKKKLAAQEMRSVELELARKADATIVLSRFELELLKELTPAAPVYEIPIVREIPSRCSKDFYQRRDIVFIGGFEHTPNVDAVKWFVAEVMPILRDMGFPGQFVVVGSNMPTEIKELAGPDIVIRGYVADLEEFFSGIRLSVAPLRYGAGLKGKVISSLSYGVPVVATSVAVEGGGFVDGVNVSIADEPREIAESISKIYADAHLWEHLSVNGHAYCQQMFSVNTVELKLREVLSDLGFADVYGSRP